MKLSKLKRDINGVQNGVWIEGAYADLDLLIASTDRKEYKEMVRRLMKPYTRNKAYEHMSDEKFSNEIQNKALAKYVLLGWKNLEDDEGNEIPYSEDKAYELLCDPEYKEFLNIVISLAEEEEVFRKQEREELSTKS